MATSLRNLTGAALDYLRARTKLFGAEAREAGGRAGVMAALGAAALLMLVVGYLLLVLATVFGIAALFEGSGRWAWGTLTAAVIHFILVGVIAVALRKKAKAPFFERSLDELKKDQQWLTQKPRS